METFFLRYWPFVRGIHGSPVNSLRKGQWCGALVVSLICVWISGWVNNREAGDLRRYRANYDVSVMNIIIVMFIILRSPLFFLFLSKSHLWVLLPLFFLFLLLSLSLSLFWFLHNYKHHYNCNHIDDDLYYHLISNFPLSYYHDKIFQHYHDSHYHHYVLLSISMLWHKQAIFESKGDKLSNAGFVMSRTPNRQQTECPLTNQPTELSRLKLKTWTRKPTPMISEHSAHSTPLPVDFHTWLWRYTCCYQ